MRIHECLDIVEQADGFAVACRKCGQGFGPADRNYKDACLCRTVDKDDLTELPPPSGRRSLGRYVEYFCPGCATLLDVETTVPYVEAVIEPVWDIEIAPASIRKAAEQARQRVPSAAE
jgi:acetone carboxylase gamma subunit